MSEPSPFSLPHALYTLTRNHIPTVSIKQQTLSSLSGHYLSTIKSSKLRRPHGSSCFFPFSYQKSEAMLKATINISITTNLAWPKEIQKVLKSFPQLVFGLSIVINVTSDLTLKAAFTSSTHTKPIFIEAFGKIQQ